MRRTMITVWFTVVAGASACGGDHLPPWPTPEELELDPFWVGANERRSFLGGVNGVRRPYGPCETDADCSAGLSCRLTNVAYNGAVRRQCTATCGGAVRCPAPWGAEGLSCASTGATDGGEATGQCLQECLQASGCAAGMLCVPFSTRSSTMVCVSAGTP